MNIAVAVKSAVKNVHNAYFLFELFSVAVLIFNINFPHGKSRYYKFLSSFFIIHYRPDKSTAFLVKFCRQKSGLLYFLKKYSIITIEKNIALKREGLINLTSHFYAMLFRMKYIDRWALMRNTRKESLAEHSLETAFIAHAIALLHNKNFQGNVNPERVALVALFHDAPEIITGDLPTPVKYYNNEIKQAYSEMESQATNHLLSLLPPGLCEDFESILRCDDEEIKKIVRAADKISALIKCKDEIMLGNTEFSSAEKATLKTIKKLDLPAADEFVSLFLKSFSLPLDEQK